MSGDLNEKQTPIENLHLEEYPKEIQEQFNDFFYNVPMIRRLVDKNRPRAKDLPRDEEGKIIIDITHPHILEDMDYFRQTGIKFRKTGRYTDLRPNKNPNSEYYKWMQEEVRRCFYGMVRPSDGEWIPGDLYFLWNYTEMQIAEKKSPNARSKKAIRHYGMPSVWEGHYLLFHYLNQARQNGNHACMLSSRAKGKSYIGAAMLAKRFKLGEEPEENGELPKGVTCYATASEKKYLVAGDQTLDKFQHNIDFISQNTEWPNRSTLTNSLANMQWTTGYKDLDKGNLGYGNSVIGISSKDDVQKLRGTRAVLYIIEEGGTFANLLKVWANALPSVEQGQGDERSVYGQLFMYGTSGDKESDFEAMGQIMYHPKGYHVEALPNIYDIDGKASREFSFFFPAYMNNEGCYDKDGNSDVTKALLAILKDRFNVKYNTSEVNALAKRMAEMPITPQEAIMQTRYNLFPITEINSRIEQIDANPSTFDDVYTGNLIQKPDGSIDFEITFDLPIRDYPLGTNKAKGAIEIFHLPEKDSSGRVFSDRYICGHDPVDNDSAETLSLTSTFVLDLFTDNIVAEYTGRQEYADENFEIVRKLCLFYNARCLYENNKRGLYAYFSKMRCTYLLADTPEYLKDKDIIKNISIGNGSKGVNATKAVNDYANKLIRDWLLLPKTILEYNSDGNEIETTVFNLHFIKNRALLKELSKFNNTDNFDRVRSLGMLMLYREQFMVQYEGNPQGQKDPATDKDYLGNDPFFTKNYDELLLNS